MTNPSNLKTAVDQLQTEIDALTARPRCCGHEHVNKAGSMYMHHAVKDDCPMHGKAEAGAVRGLRSYVGKKLGRVAEAKQAREAWQVWENKRGELAQAKRGLREMDGDLGRIGMRQQRRY